MLYAQLILGKKGTLGKVWLAVQSEKKLNRQLIFQTDLTKSAGRRHVFYDVLSCTFSSAHFLFHRFKWDNHWEKFQLALQNSSSCQARMSSSIKPVALPLSFIVLISTILSDSRLYPPTQTKLLIRKEKCCPSVYPAACCWVSSVFTPTKCVI